MEPVRCARCAEIIGVYEPVRVVLSDGTDRHGSLLSLDDELRMRGSIVVHERCYEGFGQGRDRG